MPYVNHGLAADATANCAMCTIAAIVGHNMNTNTVQGALHAPGQSDNALATGFGHNGLNGTAQLQAVLNSMISFIKRARAHLHDPFGAGYQFGVPGIGKTSVETVAYIQSKPVGSRFAVWGCQAHVMMGFGAHWNFAQHTGQGAQFTDFQDQTANGIAPATSAAFIQPAGPPRANADVYDRFIALYFN